VPGFRWREISLQVVRDLQVAGCQVAGCEISRCEVGHLEHLEISQRFRCPLQVVRGGARCSHTVNR